MNARASSNSQLPPGWVAPTEITIEDGKVPIAALLYGAYGQPAGSESGRTERPPDGTVLLLHGWADSAWSMDSIAQPLADRYRVISLDLRGHGRSGRGPYNMMHFIGDLRTVIEALELDAPILVGHSLGGQISSQFCGLFPEVPRGLIAVEGIGPPPHRLAADDPARLEREQSRRNVERTRQPARSRRLADLDEAVSRLRDSHPLLDPDRAAFLAERNSVGVGSGTAREWRFDPESRDWFNGHSETLSFQRWQGIACPVLVVNGADSHERYWKFITDDPGDFPAPLTGQSLKDRLSHFADVRYVEIPGAGHMLPYDKPDELNVAIDDFLAEL